jgi:hypothetical protein
MLCKKKHFQERASDSQNLFTSLLMNKFRFPLWLVLREMEGRDLRIPPFAKNAKDGTPGDGWRGDDKGKAEVGFAHRFRPTYPGFPVEIGGVEQRSCGFL